MVCYNTVLDITLIIDIMSITFSIGRNEKQRFTFYYSWKMQIVDPHQRFTNRNEPPHGKNNNLHRQKVEELYYPCSENKGDDQLRCYCEADQRLCFRYMDSTIPLLSKSKISSL